MSPNCTSRRRTSGVIARSGKSARMASTRASKDEPLSFLRRAAVRVTRSDGSGRAAGSTTDGSKAMLSGSSANSPSSGPDDRERKEPDDDADEEEAERERARATSGGGSGAAGAAGGAVVPHSMSGASGRTGVAGLMLEALRVAKRFLLRCGRSTL